MSDEQEPKQPVSVSCDYVTPDWTPLLSDATKAALGNGSCYTQELLSAEVTVQLRRIADALESKQGRKPWKECWGVWYLSPLAPKEQVLLCATKEEAQNKQVRNGSRIVRVQLFREEA